MSQADLCARTKQVLVALQMATEDQLREINPENTRTLARQFIAQKPELSLELAKVNTLAWVCGKRAWSGTSAHEVHEVPQKRPRIEPVPPVPEISVRHIQCQPKQVPVHFVAQTMSGVLMNVPSTAAIPAALTVDGKHDKRVKLTAPVSSVADNDLCAFCAQPTTQFSTQCATCHNKNKPRSWYCTKQYPDVIAPNQRDCARLRWSLRPLLAAAWQCEAAITEFQYTCPECSPHLFDESVPHDLDSLMKSEAAAMMPDVDAKKATLFKRIQLKFARVDGSSAVLAFMLRALRDQVQEEEEKEDKKQGSLQQKIKKGTPKCYRHGAVYALTSPVAIHASTKPN